MEGRCSGESGLQKLGLLLGWEDKGKLYTWILKNDLVQQCSGSVILKKPLDISVTH